MASEVGAELNKIMKQYEKEVEDLSSDVFQSVAKGTVQELKNTSPKKTGSYASGWAVKKEQGVGKMNFIVYNRTDYQLTHLLENGHIVRNKKGTYGRADAIPHIAPAADKAADELVEQLESKL